MGNQQSAGGFKPASKATHSLHSAICAFDEPKVKTLVASSAGTDANAVVVAEAHNTYFLFKESKPHDIQSILPGIMHPEHYGMTAIGQLASAVCISLLEQGLPGSHAPSQQLVAQIAVLLIQAGASPNAPVQYCIDTNAGTAVPVSGPAVACLRTFIARSPPDVRQARAHFLEPLLVALLRAPGLNCVSCRDVLTWADAGCASAVSFLCKAYGDVWEGSAGQGATVPPLLCLIDAGLARPVQWALEAGADANCTDRQGRTALMHCSGAFDCTVEASGPGSRRGSGAGAEAGAGPSSAILTEQGQASSTGGIAMPGSATPAKAPQQGAIATPSPAGLPPAVPTPSQAPAVTGGRNIASSRSARAILELLLTHGARPDARDCDGKTALHWLVGPECKVDLTTRVACVQRLVRAGAAVTGPAGTDAAGVTVLEAASGPSSARLQLALQSEHAWKRRRVLVQAWTDANKGRKA